MGGGLRHHGALVTWRRWRVRMTGIVRIIMDLEQDIRGKHVLIVEDIIDSGRTLHYICEALNACDPASSPPNQEKTRL